jgi:acyl carrier protein
MSGRSRRIVAFAAMARMFRVSLLARGALSQHLVCWSHAVELALAAVAALSDTAEQGCSPECLSMSTLLQADTTIRRVLRDHGRLGVDPDKLSADADLYESGMTSHASVNVMLALEGEFDVEFPDHMLKRNVFRSVGSIERALRELIAD